MTETPVAPEAAQAAPGPEKRAEAEKVLQEILRLIELPARLELKDAADGGISVAMFPEAELPGVAPGRRTHVIDAVQFLANKIVNRSAADRRWISIGVGAHPEPRPAKPLPGPAQPRAEGAAPQPQAQPPRPPRPPKAAAPQGAPAEPRPPKAAPAPAKPAEPEELKLDVAEDPELAKAIATLAERSATLGRYFAIWPMKPEDRARVLKAASGTGGVKVIAEGEGRNRRVVFHPDKPTAMPKKTGLPGMDVEDEDA